MRHQTSPAWSEDAVQLVWLFLSCRKWTNFRGVKTIVIDWKRICGERLPYKDTWDAVLPGNALITYNTELPQVAHPWSLLSVCWYAFFQFLTLASFNPISLKCLTAAVTPWSHAPDATGIGNACALSGCDEIMRHEQNLWAWIISSGCSQSWSELS